MLTEERLQKLYPHLPKLWHVLRYRPKTINELMVLCTDPRYGKLWRLNNLYKITDKNGKLVTFRMNYAQHKVYSQLQIHKRLIILKSRQQGISTLWLVSFFDDILFNKNLEAGIMSLSEISMKEMLKRVKVMWEELLPEVKYMLNITKPKQDSQKAFQLSNGSQILVASTFRSKTLQRLHISEFGDIANENPKAADEIESGSMQTIHKGNIIIIESTAKGHNRFYERWQMAEEAEKRATTDESGKVTYNYAVKDFHPVFLSWLDDPDCIESVEQEETDESVLYFKDKPEATKEQKNWWIVQQRDSGELIYREYPANSEEAFFASLTGSFWWEYYKQHVRNQGREIVGLYDPTLPLSVALDLGINDPTVMCFYQEYGPEGSDKLFRVVAEHKASDNAIPSHMNNLKDMLKTNKFNRYSQIILPHDVAQRNKNDGVPMIDEFYNQGLRELCDYVKILKPGESGDTEKSGLPEAILTVRHLFQSGKFRLDPKACPYILDCIMNYKAAWDATNRMFKDRPPTTSKWHHGADALRYAVVGRNKPVEYRQQSTQRRKWG